MNINWEYWKMVARRFVKAFVGGFLASLTVYLTANPLSNLDNVQPWLTALFIAGVTGGILALEKGTQGWDATK